MGKWGNGEMRKWGNGEIRNQKSKIEMKGFMVVLGIWGIGTGAFGQDLVAIEDSLLKYYTKLSSSTLNADRDSASAKLSLGTINR